MNSTNATNTDNIKVIARFRPENESEKATGTKIVELATGDGEEGNDGEEEEEQTCNISMKDFNGSFTFDRVFGMDSAQSDVFDYSLKQTVDDLMKGYNGTVLAYGQTGSGKSYTMMGPDIDNQKSRGAIPRIVDRIFDLILDSPTDIEYTVSVSYMEIYMEKIKDLLDPKKDNLSIHEGKTKGVYVKGLTQEYVASADEVYQVMRQGAACRATGSTNMNQQSSRSHSIFAIVVSQKNVGRGGSQKTGQLFLVDLAGSEKVGKTGASGQTLEEAKKINKSLSALGNVINSLTDGRSTHVPYRDSKLTRILQESLGGNSRTSLIVNCSPSSSNDQETLSTLRFGVRAKTIRNKAKINTELSPGELKALLKKCQAQLDSKTAYASRLEAELGMYRPSSAASSTSSRPLSTSSLDPSLIGSPISSEFSSTSASTTTTIDGGIQSVRSNCSTPQSFYAPSPLGSALTDEQQQNGSLSADDYDDEQDNSSSERQKNREKVTHLLGELKKLTDEKEELKLQLEQVKYSNQEAEIKSQVVQEENNRLTNELENGKRQIEDQQMTIKELQDDEGKPVSLTLSSSNSNSSNHHLVNEAIMVTSSLSDENDKERVTRLRQILDGLKLREDTTSKVTEILKNNNDEFKQQIAQNTENDEDNRDMITAMYESKIKTLQDTITEMSGKFDSLTEDTDNRLKEQQHQTPPHDNTASTDQVAEFEHIKKSLMNDLQDRCEKIVELEISLDKAKEQYNLALRNNSQQKRVALLQRNLEQLTTVQRQLVEQNTALKKEVAMSQKFLDSRNERIKHLEQSLLESQQALARESENFEAKLGLLRTRLMEVRKKDTASYTTDNRRSRIYDYHDDDYDEDNDSASENKSPAAAPRIVKPLRGGGGSGGARLWDRINRSMAG